MGRKAVFLDRDGVINENRDDCVKSWGEFVFLPGVRQALGQLAQCPFLVVVTSNQSAIHRRLVSRGLVDEIHRRMVKEIEMAGGRIDAVYFVRMSRKRTVVAVSPSQVSY